MPHNKSDAQQNHQNSRLPKDPERITGTAAPGSFNEEIVLPKNIGQKTLKVLDSLNGISAGSSGGEFDCSKRDLYSRIYVRDKDNYFVPAFPDATKPEWKGPTAEELNNIAAGDENYGYFNAASTDFRIITKNGNQLYTKDSYPFLFGEDGMRRVNNSFTPDEAKRFANERKIDKLQSCLNGLKRVRTIETSIFGSKMENKGDENYRNLEQRFNKYFSDMPGTAYPTANSDRQLREDDIAALTMLNITTPKISGNEITGTTEEVSILRTFNMSVGDIFINRSNPTSIFWQTAGPARQDLAKSLEKYYSNGDMTGLATTIADGFHFMAESCQNRGELKDQALSASIPLLMTMEMLQRESNAQLLEKTKEIIRERGKEAYKQFENDWRKAETLCNIYELRKKGFESELKLLRYENGQFIDEQGRAIDPTAEEREQLEADIKRSNFLSEIGEKHKNLCTGQMSPEAVSAMMLGLRACPEKAKEQLDKEQKETGRPYTEKDLNERIKELRTAISQNVEITNSTRPMSPVYTVLLEHPQGQKVLDAMLKETPNTKELYQRLEDEGMIPRKGGFDEYDPEIHKNAIETYAKWLDAEPQFKKDWEANKEFFLEQGMEYDDVAALMKTGQIKSIESYRKAFEEEEREAAAKFVFDSGLPKDEQLNSIKEMLSTGLQNDLTAADLCGAFKTINTLSKENENDPLTVYVASQLMTKVCSKLNDYMSESPEKLQEVRKFLDKDDYQSAACTVNRGKAIEKEVEVKMQKKKDEIKIKNSDHKLLQ